MDDLLNGDYWIKLKSDPQGWGIVPDSKRVFIDGGAAMFYNEDDKIILCYGRGEWIEIIHDDIYERMYPSMPLDS